MKISSFKKSTCINIIVFSIGLVLALSCANRTFADDSLEQFLTAAMENHPDVVAAKAKVALAEAELNATRLQVARQIINLWGNRNSQYDAMHQSRSQLDRTKDNVERGMLLRSIQDAQVKFEQAEAEIKYLTAKVTPIAQLSKDSKAPSKPLQIPTGPMVDRLRQELPNKIIEFEFVDTPLEQVIDYLSNYLKFPIYFDLETLCGANTIIANDQPITMSMRNTPLAAALQYFQDNHQGTQFVIRDYGILLTSIDQAKAQGYYPAVEYLREIEKQKAPDGTTPAAQPSRR